MLSALRSPVTRTASGLGPLPCPQAARGKPRWQTLTQTVSIPMFRRTTCCSRICGFMDTQGAASKAQSAESLRVLDVILRSTEALDGTSTMATLRPWVRGQHGIFSIPSLSGVDATRNIPQWIRFLLPHAIARAPEAMVTASERRQEQV